MNIYINPFLKIAGIKALIAGLAFILITSYVGSISGIHFDGVLDIHLGLKTRISTFLGESIISWLCISLTFYLLGLMLSKSSVRPIDIFGTQALSRAPMIFASIIGFVPAFQSGDTASTLMVSALMVIVIIWYIVWMFNAYKISANLKGNRLVISFIAGIFIAEALSKYLIFLFYNL